MGQTVYDKYGIIRVAASTGIASHTLVAAIIHRLYIKQSQHVSTCSNGVEWNVGILSSPVIRQCSLCFTVQ